MASANGDQFGLTRAAAQGVHARRENGSRIASTAHPDGSRPTIAQPLGYRGREQIAEMLGRIVEGQGTNISRWGVPEPLAFKRRVQTPFSHVTGAKRLDAAHARLIIAGEEETRSVRADGSEVYLRIESG